MSFSTNSRKNQSFNSFLRNIRRFRDRIQLLWVIGKKKTVSVSLMIRRLISSSQWIIIRWSIILIIEDELRIYIGWITCMILRICLFSRRIQLGQSESIQSRISNLEICNQLSGANFTSSIKQSFLTGGVWLRFCSMFVRLLVALLRF